MLSTVFINLIGIFFEDGPGIEKTDARFLFHYHSDKKREVKLIDCDAEIVSHIYSQLKNKIRSTSKI